MAPELSKYIETAQAAGGTKEQIRQALLAAGWNPADVDAALPAPTPAQSRRAGRLTVLLILLVFALAGSGYYVFAMRRHPAGPKATAGTQASAPSPTPAGAFSLTAASTQPQTVTVTRFEKPDRQLLSFTLPPGWLSDPYSPSGSNWALDLYGSATDHTAVLKSPHTYELPVADPFASPSVRRIRLGMVGFKSTSLSAYDPILGVGSGGFSQKTVTEKSFPGGIYSCGELTKDSRAILRCAVNFANLSSGYGAAELTTTAAALPKDSADLYAAIESIQLLSTTETSAANLVTQSVESLLNPFVPAPASTPTLQLNAKAVSEAAYSYQGQRLAFTAAGKAVIQSVSSKPAVPGPYYVQMLTPNSYDTGDLNGDGLNDVLQVMNVKDGTYSDDDYFLSAVVDQSGKAVFADMAEIDVNILLKYVTVDKAGKVQVVYQTYGPGNVVNQGDDQTVYFHLVNGKLVKES